METVTIEEPKKQDVKDLIASWEDRQLKEQEKALKDLKKIAAKFVKEGLSNLEVHYSGCGDCGEISEIYGIKPGDPSSRYFNYKDPEYDELAEICYNLLTYDWYNNEGGNGNISIDLVNNIIDIDAYHIVEEQAPATDQESHLKF